MSMNETGYTFKTVATVTAMKLTGLLNNSMHSSSIYPSSVTFVGCWPLQKAKKSTGNNVLDLNIFFNCQ